MSTSVITELFEEALEKEKYVLNLYLQIMNKIKDKEVIDILNKIKIDEEEHMRNVEKILKIIS
jgi:rubrerythrin